MLIAAFDQAASSGWCFVHVPADRPVLFSPRCVLEFGVARTFRQRVEVMAKLRAHMEGLGLEPQQLYAVFEDHGNVPAGKGAPTKTLLGMGRAHGHWEEQLAFFGVPESHWSKVLPAT